MISLTLSIIFPSMIKNRKHGESTICNPEIEGKEQAQWQREVSCFLIKKDEKACHISKRECYIIIINSERKKKTPPPEKNIINSRADQRREPGFILNRFLPVPSSSKFKVYLNHQIKHFNFILFFSFNLTFSGFITAPFLIWFLNIIFRCGPQLIGSQLVFLFTLQYIA